MTEPKASCRCEQDAPILSRAQRIREARIAQPMEELERKARKAVSRTNQWQVEELDLGCARGRAFAAEMEALWE